MLPSTVTRNLFSIELNKKIHRTLWDMKICVRPSTAQTLRCGTTGTDTCWTDTNRYGRSSTMQTAAAITAASWGATVVVTFCAPRGIIAVVPPACSVRADSSSLMAWLRAECTSVRRAESSSRGSTRWISTSTFPRFASTGLRSSGGELGLLMIQMGCRSHRNRAVFLWRPRFAFAEQVAQGERNRRARFGRADDIRDHRFLGGLEGRAKFVAILSDQPSLFLFRIGGGGDLAPVKNLGRALRAHDRDFRRGPGIDHIRTHVRAAHGEIRAAIGFAEDHGDFRHGGRRIGEKNFRALPT